MQQYLITTDEVSKLAHVSTYRYGKDRNLYRESENIDLKSALGDTLFLDVKNIRIIIVSYSMEVLMMYNVVEDVLLWD